MTLLLASSATFPVVAVRCAPLPTVTCTVLGAVGVAGIDRNGGRHAGHDAGAGRGLGRECLRARSAGRQRDRRGCDRGAVADRHLVVAAGIVRRQRQVGRHRIAGCAAVGRGDRVRRDARLHRDGGR